MSNNTEISRDQKNMLHDLLELEVVLKKIISGSDLATLERIISRVKSGMSQEDIAHVEKLIEKLYSNQ